MKYNIYNAERMDWAIREQSEKLGKPVKVVVIQNLANVSLQQIKSDALTINRFLLEIITDHYPERLGVCYLINLPAQKLFEFVWNIVKYLFDDNLRSKFQFLFSDWKNQLLEVIYEQDLPAYLGGTLKDPDEFCSNTLGIGGLVPESLYKGLDNSFTIINVAAMKKYQAVTVVYQPGSIIIWEFITKGHDIKFGVFMVETPPEALENSDGNENASPKDLNLPEVVVLESRRFEDSSKESVKGQLVAEKRGSYMLEFDNSYSYLRLKTVSFKFEVKLLPEIENMQYQKYLAQSY